jgi:hypothetical protein
MDGTTTTLANGVFLGNFANSSGMTAGNNGFASGAGWTVPSTSNSSVTVPIASGTVFGFAVDVDSGEVYVSRNNIWSNRSTINPIPASPYPFFSFPALTTVYPALTLFRTTESYRLRTGASELTYIPPPRFKPWG